MRRWGMRAIDRLGRTDLVRKETGWMTTSSKLVAEILGVLRVYPREGQRRTAMSISSVGWQQRLRRTRRHW